MESFSVKNMISAVDNKFPVKYTTNPVFITRIRTQLRQFRLVVYAQKWDFQDFQGYAKPKRLFPASDVQISAAPSMEQMIDSFKTRNSECLYKVRLQTSGLYGSGLTDMNAGVLLSLVDENGDSILQRIPTCHAKNHFMQSQENAYTEVLHFQRGCVDEFMFEGLTLGKIAAVWISVESGQWRIGDLTLTVIQQQQQQPRSEGGEKQVQFIGLQYNFELEDVLLGEGSDVSMMELRPCSVTEISEENITFFSLKASEPSSLASNSISGEESMKEYSDLKSSLFFYDILLILAGSSIDSVLTGENAALAFLTGGVGGFLYLLLLQKSVDGLPTPELVSSNERTNLDKIFGNFKGSASSLVLAFSFAIIVAKYISGDAARVLTPEELISGMIGFLMCKVSVVLAAFKPMPIGQRQSKQ